MALQPGQMLITNDGRFQRVSMHVGTPDTDWLEFTVSLPMKNWNLSELEAQALEAVAEIAKEFAAGIRRSGRPQTPEA